MIYLWVLRDFHFSGRTQEPHSSVSVGLTESTDIGIDHDTVCAGVGGTAIRRSTSCAGRRAAAPAGTTSAVPDGSTRHANHYSFCLIITHFSPEKLHICLMYAKKIGEIKQKNGKFFTISSYIKHFFGWISKLLSISKIECWHLCSTTHDSADRISGQFLFYHDHNFTKSKGNLRFQRHVPLFVPIGVCVTTHDDGTASDVTIGMWRHNQQATNHERNGKPWFSFPK